MPRSTVVDAGERLRRINLSIMPTIDGRHRSDLYAVREVKPDMPDDEVGEVIGDFLRDLSAAGVNIGQDMVELQIRIY